VGGGVGGLVGGGGCVGGSGGFRDICSLGRALYPSSSGKLLIICKQFSTSSANSLIRLENCFSSGEKYASIPFCAHSRPVP